MKARVSECRIVGGMFSADGSSPIDCADIVARRLGDDGNPLRIERYQDGLAEGTEYAQSEWSRLVSDGQVTELFFRDSRVTEGTSILVLRSELEHRSEWLMDLKEAMSPSNEVAWVSEAPRTEKLSAVCAVKREEAIHIAEGWLSTAMCEFERSAELSEWEAALRSAECAFAIRPCRETARVLAIALEKDGRKERGDMLQAMFAADATGVVRMGSPVHRGSV
jgi:hypothetical protein